MEDEPKIRRIDPKSPGLDKVRGRLFQERMGEVEPVVLADDRPNGGFLISAHPAVLRDMERLGLSAEQIIQFLRENVPDEPPE